MPNGLKDLKMAIIDIGAHNGVSINNTLYFEKHNNWTGINVEPINIFFLLLFHFFLNYKNEKL